MFVILNCVSCFVFLAHREMDTSRQEHDIGVANQPEKEEQKQRKENR
jgi:hypothetical protein